MFDEDTSARLSVRAVAARAGVSMGSLRHHFPTQRALQDAVLAAVYDQVARGDGIHDWSVPARERLLGCLRQVLAAADTGEQARTAWGELYRRFIEPEPTEEIRAAYRAIEGEGLRRVEYWLTVLADEGALPEGDNKRRASGTVLTGCRRGSVSLSALSLALNECSATTAVTFRDCFRPRHTSGQ